MHGKTIHKEPAMWGKLNTGMIEQHKEKTMKSRKVIPPSFI